MYRIMVIASGSDPSPTRLLYRHLTHLGVGDINLALLVLMIVGCRGRDAAVLLRGGDVLRHRVPILINVRRMK